jgi:hypothetical protein
MKELRAYALGGAFMVFADRIFDVQELTYPALAVIMAAVIAKGVKYGRRLYA